MLWPLVPRIRPSRPRRGSHGYRSNLDGCRDSSGRSKIRPAMSSGILHYKLVCSGCGMPILLPLEMLNRAFPGLALQSTDSLHIAAVCIDCNRVRMYTLTPKIPGSLLGPLVDEPKTSDWACRGTLQCDVATCEARLQVFSPSNSPTTDEEWQAYVRNWIWESPMLCSNGHVIPPRRYLPPTQ